MFYLRGQAKLCKLTLQLVPFFIYSIFCFFFITFMLHFNFFFHKTGYSSQIQISLHLWPFSSHPSCTIKSHSERIVSFLYILLPRKCIGSVLHTGQQALGLDSSGLYLSNFMYKCQLPLVLVLFHSTYPMYEFLGMYILQQRGYKHVFLSHRTLPSSKSFSGDLIGVRSSFT